MRFVRTKKVDQTVVELNDISSLKKKRSEFIATEASPTSAPNESLERTHTSESDRSEEKTTEINCITETELSDFPIVEDDSTTISSKEAEMVKAQAVRSEKQGTWSFILALMSYVMFILGIVAFLIVINLNYYNPAFIWIFITFFMFGLSLASLVTSTILGIKSLRARYATPIGRRRAILGLIFSGLAVLLILLNIFGSLL